VRPRRASELPSSDAPRRAPLDGVTIVEIGSFYAAPFGAAMLADHGARVIKIEPLTGDPIRHVLPLPEVGGVRATQGKESIAIEVGTPEGHELAIELIKRADMVLQSYRGGAAERMGLGSATALAANPDLVYHNGQGFGVDGPYADRVAYAPIIGAASGFAVRSGGGGPEGVELTVDEIKDAVFRTAGAQVGLTDAYAALGVGTALALGLLAKRRGAGGQVTMTSMLSTMGHVLSDVMIDYEGVPAPAETDPDWFGFGALYRVYEAADGWVVLCVTDDREWAALAAVIDSDGSIATDARFASAAARTTHDAELVALLADVFRSRGASEWEKMMSAADVACVEIEDLAGGVMAMMDEGGIAERLGMTMNVSHPLFDEHVRTTELVCLSRSAPTLGPGVTIGQHTDTILRELGLSDDRIADLRERKVVA
jgi:crotonobetainyl-CoA:carnitine CoA-transferase CaiB-like acyl-CoA transferase